ncbi:MAG TPA: DUF4249 family protein [Gemmatimonadaceae bacterium]|jgi:hypothetical protein|nr:DUF4249 family protein [Gemmatimonadaceae bacterium]
MAASRVKPLRMLVACVAIAAAACTFDQQTVAVQPSQVVVHAVLDPGGTEQQVLVERTLSGTVDIPKNQRFDPEDPINSGGGIPISGCQVTVTGPTGEFFGVEAPAPGRPSTYSTGRYILTSGTITNGPRIPLRAGGRYELRVRTPDGTIVTGSTVIPQASPFTPGSRLERFNRDQDTVRLVWKAAATARSYLIRVESPFGPFLLFSDSIGLELPGNLRNYFASSLERVFIPGFRQRVEVAAVDSNYYDYYRSRNDPFTGSGIINKLRGGIGLFGSAVSIHARTLDVTQDAREPAIEGTYDVTTTPTLSRPVADALQLYVESSGEPAALSGWFTRNRTSGVLEGMLGTRKNGRVALEFLENQSSVDTVAVFAGEQRGDSLVGGYVGVAGTVVFVKRR